ncbi:virulence protein IpgD [Cupriavidus sp. YR651]|uniref:inositol phosphate phosphatase SopB n=1 Tax=Cupriavidus sp. YR651 TaxID=1855315 RepID=UPI000888FD4F|nr:inositol phosphate phosphatase SopB [Cupriavidus sp. YR651]SDD38259.1 virulence protein IpgD [Cupriavidus sp. YR651]
MIVTPAGYQRMAALSSNLATDNSQVSRRDSDDAASRGMCGSSCFGFVRMLRNVCASLRQFLTPRAEPESLELLTIDHSASHASDTGSTAHAGDADALPAARCRSLFGRFVSAIGRVVSLDSASVEDRPTSPQREWQERLPRSGYALLRVEKLKTDATRDALIQLGVGDGAAAEQLWQRSAELEESMSRMLQASIQTSLGRALPDAWPRIQSRFASDTARETWVPCLSEMIPFHCGASSDIHQVHNAVTGAICSYIETRFPHVTLTDDDRQFVMRELKLDLLAADGGGSAQTVDRIRRIDDMLVRKIADALPDMNDKGVVAEQALRRAVTSALNRRPWNTVEAAFPYGEVHYVSTLTPAAQMRYDNGNGNGIHAVDYGNGGVCSRTTDEAQHAVNLWISRFSANGNQPGGGELLFEGVRSGVMSAFGIADPEKRAAANLARAKEVVTAALWTQREKWDRALAGEIVDLHLVSTSLLTPGNLAGEDTMLKEQMEAWAALDAMRVVELPVRDENGESKTISVALRVAAFNFGVNEFALKLHGGLDTSDAYNREALRKLVGPNLATNVALSPSSWAGSYIRTTPQPDNMGRVYDLAWELKDFMAKGSHHHDDDAPYKAAQRAAMLAFEIGAVPCWNCKSGKDRTGMLDAEIKREATLLTLQHDARQRGDTTWSREEAERSVMESVVLHSGNLEVQERNTGVMGNKVLKRLPAVSGLSLSYVDRMHPDILKAGHGWSGVAAAS